MEGALTPGPDGELYAGASLRELQSLVPPRRDPSRRSGDLHMLSWNVHHGRDHPPDDELYTLRSRVLRITERNETHVQVNRSLRDEVAGVLAATRWDVCLLQECPPRWASELADQGQANAFRVLTSRNWLRPVRGLVAEHNPDLMGSWEGGSNLTLVRLPWRIVETRAVLLNPFRERHLHERRRLALTRLVDGDREVCVGNLHLSAGLPEQAAREARRAAEVTLDWAAGAPVVLGGDFNLRPRTSAVFDDLCEGAHLCGATDPDAIDHVLSRSLEPVAGPRRWPPERREVSVLTGLERRLLRLSDHAPVEVRLRVPTSQAAAAGGAPTPESFEPGVR